MKKNKGFTLVELLVVVSIIALLVGLLLPALSRVRDSARQVKCGTNVRAIHQGVVSWSQDDDGLYPLPTRNDPDNLSEDWDETIQDRTTNRTGNVWSLLIFNKVLNTEVFISPAETNVNIRKPRSGFQKEASEYHFEGPLAAPTESRFRALYDPQFKGSASEFDDAANLTFPDGGESQTPDNVGHNSYAHAPLTGVRLNGMWSTFAPSPNIPVISNRGPMYDSPYPKAEPVLDQGPHLEKGLQSLTLGIHGGKATWEGNVAYNDGSTKFVTKPNPDGQRRIEYGTEDESAKINDNLFVDEELAGVAAPDRDNSYLRIWSKGLPFDRHLLTANNQWFQNPDENYFWVD